VKVSGVTFDGIDLLMETFRNRGIELTSVEQLISSSRRSEEGNRAILLAWADLRDRLGIPKPAKKKVEITASPVVEPGAIIATGETTIDRVVEVTERMPDGGLVESQPEIEVEQEEQPAPLPTIVDPAAAQVLEQAVASHVVPAVVPSPVQVAPVRQVASRPMPVKSSVPPRPMPVKGQFGETHNQPKWTHGIFGTC
jgi:hypothetical protein